MGCDMDMLSVITYLNQRADSRRNEVASLAGPNVLQPAPPAPCLPSVASRFGQ
jgi:hypothetical protein